LIVAAAWAIFVVFWMLDVRRHLESIRFTLLDVLHELESGDED
jgi:hypothetical protein